MPGPTISDVRSSGVTVSARGLGPHDHACWDYASVDEFRTRALEFLDDERSALTSLDVHLEGDALELPRLRLSEP